MSANRERRHFIIKHDLDSLERLPNYIWRTNKGPRSLPHRYRELKPGDRWVAFAYYNDAAEQPLSLVTGFFECTKEAEYRTVPKAVDLNLDYDWVRKGYAWMVKGRAWGEQPSKPVGVRPINDILRPKKVFSQQAITPVTADDFAKIRRHVQNQEFNTRSIPLIGREPTCEQELLAIVMSAYQRLGIQKIIRVRKAFPDLLVQIGGQEMHLELETYSRGFFLHHHDKHVVRRRFSEDGKPVAILCWIDNCDEVKQKVKHVYALRSILRSGGKITVS